MPSCALTVALIVAVPGAAAVAIFWNASPVSFSSTMPSGSTLHSTVAPAVSMFLASTVSVEVGWLTLLTIWREAELAVTETEGSVEPNLSTSVPFSVVQLLPNFPATVSSSVLWKGVPKVLPPSQEVFSQ